MSKDTITIYWTMKNKKATKISGFMSFLDVFGSNLGGAGGNRTPVRKSYTASTTYLA